MRDYLLLLGARRHWRRRKTRALRQGRIVPGRAVHATLRAPVSQAGPLTIARPVRAGARVAVRTSRTEADFFSQTRRERVAVESRKDAVGCLPAVGCVFSERVPAGAGMGFDQRLILGGAGAGGGAEQERTRESWGRE